MIHITINSTSAVCRTRGARLLSTIAKFQRARESKPYIYADVYCAKCRQWLRRGAPSGATK